MNSLSVSGKNWVLKKYSEEKTTLVVPLLVECGVDLSRSAGGHDMQCAL